MKNEFIETTNVHQSRAICDELVSDESRIGPSMAMITGPAGRGKSESAKKIAVDMMEDAVYIPPLNVRSPAMVLREICFELSMLRPHRSEACLEVIAQEMAKHRRLIMIDEADLLEMRVLEMIRNLNERYACPVLLIGEDELKSRVASRRRIHSRIRRSMEFGPVSQADIQVFFKRSIEKPIDGKSVTLIHRKSKGDWRPVLTIAAAIERAMKASGINEITEELVKHVVSQI